MNTVWVFHGEGANFAAGVFSTREVAEQWIKQHALSGLLTLYPVDAGVYEWAIQNGYFTPKRDYQRTPKFIQRFSCGYEHYHYENGQCVA